MSDAAGIRTNRLVLVGIVAILIAYVVSVGFGLPQAGARLLAEQHGHETAEEAVEEPASHPPYWTVAPFVLLLLAIAAFPLMPKIEHWWESNLHRFFVAAGLGALTLVYYLFFCGYPIIGHFPAEHVVEPSPGPNIATALAVLGNAISYEYIPFIVLLFTLYTISGGIRIEGDLQARPSTNSMFLAAGAVLASFIGTTGAAMLLIRPLLETNFERKRVRHTVIFFIFVVCNCGGCLLPLGDPPLFLGYLLHVPFFWTLKLWPEWLFVNAVLIAVYYLWDRFWHYPHETIADRSRDRTELRPLTFMGLGLSVPLLIGVVLSITFLSPSKPLPVIGWRPWPYLREIMQLALVGVSLAAGHRSIRRQNQFSYAAIIEVAALFLGIFICMQPALAILRVEGPALGLKTPAEFFWATGSLSSVLDNAPTYVVFFTTAQSLGPAEGETMVAGVRENLLVAISLGAVFMGAMTYIGNGPNFMVRAIAEKAGVNMPSFFGYLVYSCVFLLPVFAAVTFLFG